MTLIHASSPIVHPSSRTKSVMWVKLSLLEHAESEKNSVAYVVPLQYQRALPATTTESAYGAGGVSKTALLRQRPSSLGRKLSRKGGTVAFMQSSSER